MKVCTSENKKHVWAWLRNIEVLRISVRGCKVTRKTAVRGLYRCANCVQKKEGRTHLAPTVKERTKEAA
jgi:hypothetical protein